MLTSNELVGAASVTVDTAGCHPSPALKPPKWIRIPKNVEVGESNVGKKTHHNEYHSTCIHKFTNLNMLIASNRCSSSISQKVTTSILPFPAEQSPTFVHKPNLARSHWWRQFSKLQSNQSCRKAPVQCCEILARWSRAKIMSQTEKNDSFRSWHWNGLKDLKPFSINPTLGAVILYHLYASRTIH